MATLALAAVWNLATYLFVMVGATPGLTYRQAFVATESTTAVVEHAARRRRHRHRADLFDVRVVGFSRSRTSVSLVVAGLWNNFVKLGMPVLALSSAGAAGRAERSGASSLPASVSAR